MNRRSFFGSLLGGLLCKFLPKPKINPTRVDMLDLSRWGRNFQFNPDGGDNLRRGSGSVWRIYSTYPSMSLGPFPADSPQAEMMRKIEARIEADKKQFRDALDRVMYESRRPSTPSN